MKQTAFDTTIGSTVDQYKLSNAIINSIIQDNDLVNVNLGLKKDNKLHIKPIFITGYHSTEKEIPLFNHPILMQYKQVTYLSMDVRPFLRQIMDENITSINLDTIIIGNQNDFILTRNKALLELAWLDDKQQQLKLNLSFGGLIFAHWISDVLTRNMSLDSRDQVIAVIIAHLYYQNLFIRGEWDDVAKDKAAIHCKNVTQYPAELVLSVAAEFVNGDTVDDLVTNLKNGINNLRLSTINSGTLITSVSSSWFGYEAKNTIAVSLEHPPTWLALVNSAITDRSFKKSLIANIIDRFGKSDKSTNFSKGFNTVVEPYLIK